MSRLIPLAAAAIVVASIPADLLAGGPPRVCLPIDGVTDANAQDCSRLLSIALGKRLNRAKGIDGVEMRQRGGQWYVVLPIPKDVRLSDFDAAFKDSPFLVPRDRLRLFGMVTLEIDGHLPALGKLVHDLNESVDGVSVHQSKRENGVVNVTLATPYAFTRNIFEELETAAATKAKATKSKASDAKASVGDLPSYAALRDYVDAYEIEIRDVRWTMNFSCRMVGCVVAPKQKTGKGAAVAKK